MPKRLRVIGVSGQSGSGKTSITVEIARQLNISVVSFGSYVRSEVLQHGIESNRETLQDFGQILVREYGYDLFVKHVFQHGNIQDDSFVALDGIRHADIWRAVQKLAQKSFLIYVHCHEMQRIERLMRRDGLSEAIAQRVVHHPMDRNAALLRPFANVVIASGTIDGSVESIIDRMVQEHMIERKELNTQTNEVFHCL